jgi:dihydropyrimidine dehydrogenase (NAD+) subunit PreT
VYRRGFDGMSATHHEIAIAKANFVRIRTWAAPLDVLVDDGGRVMGMRFEETRMDGTRLVGTGAYIDIAADAVFKAIGQSMEAISLADDMANALRRQGDRIGVDDHFRTAVAGIYAGGDCVAPGQDLTVQAVQHGKLAAHAIHNDIQSNVTQHRGAAWPT